jgi:tetratricopeptide (TPR) repeat protein
MALAAALVTVAMGPLVVRPLTAQLAECRAGAAPAGGLEWARALEQAEAAAPYDAHYPARFALERYGRAQAERDRGLRRTLLEEGLAAARRAVAIEPQSGFWRLYVARFQAELARLSPPGASAAEVSDAVYGAIALDPANAQVLDDGGNALYQVGLRGEARALELRSLQLYPDFAEPLALIGMFALKEGRLADGTDTLVLALKRDWKDARRPHASALSNLSVAYLAAGRVREARDAAAEALRLEPDSQILRDNLARAERRLSMESVAGDSLAAGRP